MIAFGNVGYYLDDTTFLKYETIILEKIDDAFNDISLLSFLGDTIFDCLYGVSYRISQDVMANILQVS